MMYLLDTVTMVRHFSNSGTIGKSAAKILDNFPNSDDEFAISIVSLMEIMYLSEKNRINIDLNNTIDLLIQTSGYRIIDLITEIILSAQSIQFYELHDRMILATAKWLGIPIISSDRKFNSVEGIEVIW